MDLIGRRLSDVRVWTWRHADDDELTVDGRRFWLCFTDGYTKIVARGDGSLTMVPATRFNADDVRADLADEGADIDVRWLSVVHMLFNDLPDLPVVDVTTVDQAGMTGALELVLGDGRQWIRIDAWHMCGSLTISGGYRERPTPA